MRATGIVRRIDDLGRVVIPKEIRRSMRIREGDPLEIFTDKDGSVTFRKYSPLGDLNEMSAMVVKTINNTTGCKVAVVDRDTVLNVAGIPRRDTVDKHISAELIEMMEMRMMKKVTGEVYLSDGNDSYPVDMVFPIIVEGDMMGAVVLLKEEVKSSSDVEKIAVGKNMAALLGANLES